MLDPLPPQDNEYWTGVEADTQILTPKPIKCEHHFIRTSVKEVECRYCHVGFFIDSKTTLKDGHIYLGEEKVI